MSTVKLSREINLSRVSYHLYQPVPGTEAFDTFVKDKNIQWEKIRFSESMFTPEGITSDELKKIQRKAFLQFYLRPNVLFNFLKHNMTINQMNELFKMFKEYIIHKEEEKIEMEEEQVVATGD